MKSKYEISIWQDEFDQELNRFIEKKIIIIGSDTMTSENRAREPKMVSNINGINKFTFNMYYSYIDTRTGEKIKNPYIQYLVNERKIKVFWKDEWYNLLVKQIKEDQVNHLFTYTCEDAYITELSRTGFELEFNTELQNNIGTARELVEQVIKNTDWRFNAELSDDIYQETEEAVYTVQVETTFQATKEPTGELVNILPYNILIFYSSAPDINNLKSTLQFYYTGGGFEHDENKMLVTNGTSYHVDVTWDVNEDENKAIASVNNIHVFTLNFNDGLSQQYRAKRFVNSDKTSYNPILKRYVNDFQYGDKVIHGYQTTEFQDASFVVNLFTNASNFSNVSGWNAPNQEESKLLFRLYPEYGKQTIIKDYIATSFLRLKGKKEYTNTGIFNNRSYISDGFIKGDKYIFRLKIQSDEGSGLLPSGIYLDSLDLNFGIDGFFELNDTITKNGDWLYKELECLESCPYNDLSEKEIKIKINTSTNYYWIEEIQFYRAIKGLVDGQEQYLEPNQFDSQAIAQTVWKYYNDEDNKDVINQKDFVYMYTSLEPWSDVTLLTNDYMRYGTIEEDNSNRFNILQSIAESFECWVRFYIDQDSKGNIIYDDNGPRKFVYLKREAGQETGIGFVYGIDLKSIVRTIKSDKISTKTIVQDNDNEFGQNGFCSIARSTQNFSRENIIYNFDYYISHGLLEKDIVYNDLYTRFNGSAGFYSQLHYLNSVYDDNLKKLSNKKIELNREAANQTVYGQYITSAREEKNEIENNLYKLTNTSTMQGVISYANSHPRNTKVHTLLNDRALIVTDLNKYELLVEDLNKSIEDLQEQISNLTVEQSEIVSSLIELNSVFYKKYSRFIQEGTWTSEDYWNDDLYYLDAVQVAYTSSRPQVSYEINVLRISDLDDYSSKKFYLGDISFVQDIEYFGYMQDKITPYKERVVLTEITSFFDTPDKDTIKVQNYKTQFDDLFQRVTAAVQSLEFNEGKYARVSNIVNDDGTIKSNVIQNTFNLNKDLVYGAQNESATIDNTGITVIDMNNKEKIVRVTSGGVFVTTDGGNNWKNAIRGDGVSTDALTAGHVDTERITIYNGNYPSFCWDPYGLNAYHFKDDIINTAQFVRFDQYGIYGMYMDGKGEDITFIPQSEDEVFEKAKFGLTWNRFFMKASNTDPTDKRMVTITSEDGILVTDKDENILFQCSPNFEETGLAAQIGGWKITKNSIESFVQKDESQYISINATGNIGCYGGDAYDYEDYVYTIKLTNTIPDEFVERMDGGDKQSLLKGMTIYPYFSSVGQTKTTFVEGDKVNEKYIDPENVPKQGQLPLISTLSFAVVDEDNDITYRIRGTEKLDLVVKAVCIDSFDEICKIEKQIDPVTGNEILSAIYTYHFNLIFSYFKKEDNKEPEEIILFTIPYTEIITNDENSTPKKKHYVPSADTTWSINKDGKAIFHDIIADGGKIAGWFIDSEKIYQTTNGEPDGPIKTQLNSNGTGKTDDGFDYSIITDAINAAMASIGGVLMSGGLINGYSIAAIAAAAYGAQATANQASNTANQASATAATAAKTANTAAETANTALFKAGHHQHGGGSYYVVAKEGTLSVGGVSGNPTA